MGGRAWVKMVVENPRNENNRGDKIAMGMMRQIVDGAIRSQYTAHDAVYYAEPIRATGGCLKCHGSPAGEPDPYFPQYAKNGWKAGEVIGAVVARVAAE